MLPPVLHASRGRTESDEKTVDSESSDHARHTRERDGPEGRCGWWGTGAGEGEGPWGGGGGRLEGEGKEGQC